MAKYRDYNIHLIPANRQDGILSFSLMDKNSRDYQLRADGFDAIGVFIRQKIQSDMKTGCIAFVSVPKGERKPPGFDAYKQANLRFIEYKAPAEVSA